VRLQRVGNTVTYYMPTQFSLGPVGTVCYNIVANTAVPVGYRPSPGVTQLYNPVLGGLADNTNNAWLSYSPNIDQFGVLSLIPSNPNAVPLTSGHTIIVSPHSGQVYLP
jgi:hypothetical protein